MAIAGSHTSLCQIGAPAIKGQVGAQTNMMGSIMCSTDLAPHILIKNTTAGYIGYKTITGTGPRILDRSSRYLLSPVPRSFVENDNSHAYITTIFCLLINAADAAFRGSGSERTFPFRRE